MWRFYNFQRCEDRIATQEMALAFSLDIHIANKNGEACFTDIVGIHHEPVDIYLRSPIRKKA